MASGAVRFWLVISMRAGVVSLAILFHWVSSVAAATLHLEQPQIVAGAASAPFVEILAAYSDSYRHPANTEPLDIMRSFLTILLIIGLSSSFAIACPRAKQRRSRPRLQSRQAADAMSRIRRTMAFNPFER